ncbi:MAG: ATP-binding cassette domain-containing protein [Thermofilum sp.]
MPAAVVVESLVKNFKGVRALSGVSMRVEEGEVRGVLGPNGAGKTTMMRILTTQLRPTSGEAWVLGYHVVREAGRVRRHIGYVPQEFSVWSDLTGYENLSIYAKLYGIPRDRRERIVWDMLDFMDLREAADRLVKTYSGGMIRRLELAAALMVSPRVLFLDEPTIGLDPRARELVWSKILEYVKEYNATVVFNTHYMDEAERYAHRVTVMNQGVVVAEGTPEELVKLVGESSVIRVYINSGVEKAVQLLSRVPGVILVSSKNPLVARLDDAERGMVQIMKVLVEGGVSVEQVSLRNPTLEDVFIKLTGKTFEEAETESFQAVLATRRAIRKGG